MLEQLHFRDEFSNACSQPTARSVVTVWPDDVGTCITDTNEKILPVDIKNVSILKVCSCYMENISVRFVLKYVCSLKE